MGSAQPVTSATACFISAATIAPQRPHAQHLQHARRRRAGLHIAALIGNTAVLALMPISGVGAVLLLLWLLVLLLPPSRPATAPSTAADADWRPPRAVFSAHRAATATLSTLLLLQTVLQYLLWVRGSAWFSRRTCATLTAAAGLICGGSSGDAGASQDVFHSLVGSSTMLACLATHRCDLPLSRSL